MGGQAAASIRCLPLLRSTFAISFNPTVQSSSLPLSSIITAGACFNLTQDNPPGLQGDGWDVQCCHEVVQPIGQYGLPNDCFWPSPFNVTQSIQSCQAQFNGTTPRPYWVEVQYGGEC